MSSDYVYMQINALTAAVEKLNFTHLQPKITTIFVHQYFLSFEIDTDAGIPATSLSTWWNCSNIYTYSVCSCCIPDVKIIWYSKESQSGKASQIVSVVMQCDGSQGDSGREYEQ